MEIVLLSASRQKNCTLKDVAGGFLNRALNVAISTGEANEARRIIEEEIRQMRTRSLEDQNVWRTWGLLAPMFGLLGTLLLWRVIRTLEDPAAACWPGSSSQGACCLALTLTLSFSPCVWWLLLQPR